MGVMTAGALTTAEGPISLLMSASKADDVSVVTGRRQRRNWTSPASETDVAYQAAGLRRTAKPNRKAEPKGELKKDSDHLQLGGGDPIRQRCLAGKTGQHPLTEAIHAGAEAVVVDPQTATATAAPADHIGVDR